MNHIVYALVALFAYSLVPPLTKIAMRDLPADTVALVTNGILVVAVLGIVVVGGKPLGSALTHESAPYMYAAGFFLAVGIVAYYRALEAGSVSVVVPIFGLFLAVSSAIGIAFLEEALTARKALGIVLAIAAVYLTTVEG